MVIFHVMMCPTPFHTGNSHRNHQPGASPSIISSDETLRNALSITTTPRHRASFDRRSIAHQCAISFLHLLVALLLLLLVLLDSGAEAFSAIPQAQQHQRRTARAFSTLSALPTRGGAGAASENGKVGLPAPCDIRVIGVGGGGGNAVNHMVENTQLPGVSFTTINTDAQALAKSLASNMVNIGRRTTRGLGAGGDPAVGAKAALESVDELEGLVKGADMVFITAGMGGGTGSGAAPVLAQIAKENDCLTVAVVTKPFGFEGRKRMQQAEAAIEALRQHVDTLIVVSNDKLLQIVPDDTPLTDAFLVADDVLRQGVIGISEIILKAGLVNVDFADVRAVMKDAGAALIGIGTGVGHARATEAAVAALSSPLLEFPIHKAQRVVFNIVGGETLGLGEVNEASAVVYENCDENANIIFGALIDPDMGDEVSVTVLACGFEDSASYSTGAARSFRPTTNYGGGGDLTGGSGSSSPPERPPMRREFKKPTSGGSSGSGGNASNLFGGDKGRSTR